MSGRLSYEPSGIIQVLEILCSLRSSRLEQQKASALALKADIRGAAEIVRYVLLADLLPADHAAGPPSVLRAPSPMPHLL
jgi:hypothetical protein